LEDQKDQTQKSKQKIKRKKREIRVFVSSTFRDFAKEREEVIKKAFREVSIIAHVNIFIHSSHLNTS